MITTALYGSKGLCFSSQSKVKDPKSQALFYAEKKFFGYTGRISISKFDVLLMASIAVIAILVVSARGKLHLTHTLNLDTAHFHSHPSLLKFVEGYLALEMVRVLWHIGHCSKQQPKPMQKLRTTNQDQLGEKEEKPNSLHLKDISVSDSGEEDHNPFYFPNDTKLDPSSTEYVREQAIIEIEINWASKNSVINQAAYVPVDVLQAAHSAQKGDLMQKIYEGLTHGVIEDLEKKEYSRVDYSQASDRVLNEIFDSQFLEILNQKGAGFRNYFLSKLSQESLYAYAARSYMQYTPNEATADNSNHAKAIATLIIKHQHQQYIEQQAVQQSQILSLNASSHANQKIQYSEPKVDVINHKDVKQAREKSDYRGKSSADDNFERSCDCRQAKHY